MRIGDIKVKRNYMIAQMVLDAVAVIIWIVIIQGTFSFGVFIEEQNNLIHSVNSDINDLVVWQWSIIWIFLSAGVIAASLFMIYCPRKMPKKYIVNKDNAQKYSDIVITAITCIRIPALLAVFELMYMHQQIMIRNYYDIIPFQILLDILLSVIIIRFSIHRVRLIQPKKEDKEIIITED